MNLLRYIIIIVCIVAASACEQPATGAEAAVSTQTRTVAQFQFLQAGMALATVSEKIGPPDRRLGSGQPRWEYDLSDGSIVVLMLMPNSQGEANWTVAWFGQQRQGAWLWSKPENYK